MKLLRQLGFVVAYVLIAGGIVSAQQYVTKIYTKQGGDEMVVSSEGQITIQTGGTISLEAGAAITRSDLPVRELAVKRRLSSAEVLAIKTTPITLVPAVAGYVLIPTECYFHKPAGTAYTLTSVVAFGVYSNGTSECGGTGVATGLLDSSSETHIVMWGPGSASVLFSGTNIISIGSGSLDIKATGADPAAGNSPLDVFVKYRQIPITWTAN